MSKVAEIVVSRPDDYVVNSLECLLRDAEAGVLRSFIICCDYGNRGYMTRSAGSTPPAEAVGMLNMADLRSVARGS
jgi:hypothetical protein